MIYLRLTALLLLLVVCCTPQKQEKKSVGIDLDQMAWEVNGVWDASETYSQIINKVNTHFDCPELIKAVGSKGKKRREYSMELNLETNQGRMKFYTDKKIYPLKLFLVGNHRFKLIYPNGSTRYFKTINEKITFRHLDKNHIYFEYTDCKFETTPLIQRNYGADSLEKAQEDYDLNELYWSFMNRHITIQSKEFSDKWEDRNKRHEIGYEKYNPKINSKVK